MNYQLRQPSFQAQGRGDVPDCNSSHEDMCNNQIDSFHNGALNLADYADPHGDLLGVLSSQREGEKEAPESNTSVQIDSPLQCYLRNKNLQSSQSTALTSMGSTLHTESIASTQHTLNMTNDAWPGASSHDIDDDESLCINDDDESLYSFAAADLLDPYNAVEPDDDWRSAFTDHEANFSDSFDAKPCVITFNDDTRAPILNHGHDSMGSLNEAFENLNKCMERTARTRSLLKKLPDRLLLSKGNSARSLNLSAHHVTSFNSSFNSLADHSSSGSLCTAPSLSSTRSRRNPSTQHNATGAQNAVWNNSKSDVGRRGRRVHTRLPATKAKSAQVVKDKMMVHSGLVKCRVDSKRSLVSTESQDSLCSTASSSNWKLSSSSHHGRRSLLTKERSIQRLSSRSITGKQKKIPGSIDEALKLLESGEVTGISHF